MFSLLQPLYTTVWYQFFFLLNNKFNSDGVFRQPWIFVGIYDRAYTVCIVEMVLFDTFTLMNMLPVFLQWTNSNTHHLFLYSSQPVDHVHVLQRQIVTELLAAGWWWEHTVLVIRKVSRKENSKGAVLTFLIPYSLVQKQREKNREWGGGGWVFTPGNRSKEEWPRKGEEQK